MNFKKTLTITAIIAVTAGIVIAMFVLPKDISRVLELILIILMTIVFLWNAITFFTNKNVILKKYPSNVLRYTFAFFWLFAAIFYGYQIYADNEGYLGVQREIKEQRLIRNFEKLEYGDLGVTVDRLVGPYDRNVGNGTKIYSYKMSDDSIILISFHDDRDKYNDWTVKSVIHINNDGSSDSLLD